MNLFRRTVPSSLSTLEEENPSVDLNQTSSFLHDPPLPSPLSGDLVLNIVKVHHRLYTLLLATEPPPKMSTRERGQNRESSSSLSTSARSLLARALSGFTGASMSKKGTDCMSALFFLARKEGRGKMEEEGRRRNELDPLSSHPPPLLALPHPPVLSHVSPLMCSQLRQIEITLTKRFHKYWRWARRRSSVEGRSFVQSLVAES